MEAGKPAFTDQPVGQALCLAAFRAISFNHCHRALRKALTCIKKNFFFYYFCRGNTGTEQGSCPKLQGYQVVGILCEFRYAGEEKFCFLNYTTYCIYQVFFLCQGCSALMPGPSIITTTTIIIVTTIREPSYEVPSPFPPIPSLRAVNTQEGGGVQWV